MSKSNFLYWKELVGLEEYNFPHLISLDEKNINLARISQSRAQEIRKAIATNQLVDIQVQPGWGATTLYRYMADDIRFKRLNLIVMFDFEADDFQDGDLAEKDFIFQIKWKMASGMIAIMMEQSLQELYMYDVFEFEDTGEKPWRGHLREKRRELKECEDNRKKFYEKFPFFSRMDVTDCLNYFLHNFQIQTVFLYLFPRKAEEDSLLEFVGIIKNIFDGKDVAPAAVREVFFLTPKMFSMMKQVYERPYKDIIYKQYSAAEIFGMLMSTYKLSDFSDASIGNVFEQEFITRVYDKALTLNEIMEKVEEEIIEYLDGEDSEVPYKLTINRTKEEN